MTDTLLPHQYRPPGRSARSGRAQTDNDVFEGLPVKQWGQQMTHISLAPPKPEDANPENNRWAEPPMPRDYQLLQPWTQQLLRLARSGKVGTKRKQDQEFMDEDGKVDDEGVGGGEDGGGKAGLEEREYVAKKWKWVPEALLEPEHKHFEFLAKRRKGLPSLYGPEQAGGALVVPMRKAKVQRPGTAEGEILLYEVLVPEGVKIDGEVPAEVPPELAELIPVAVTAGTVIEGLGIANDEGVIVAEHLKPALAAAPRRNRPPPKKKGGPGRGKKRVTFTNPDGSTYTTIVPNATKIVPQPGQTVKHVAKGEEATADITAEQAAAQRKDTGDEGEDGDGGDEGSDEGDDEDDDGREEGELSDEEDDGAKSTAPATPIPGEKKAGSEKPEESANGGSGVDGGEEDTTMEDAQPPPAAVETEPPKTRDASSSPELPLARTSHSRQNSHITPPPPPPAAPPADAPDEPDEPDEPEAEAEAEADPTAPTALPETAAETSDTQANEPDIEVDEAAAEPQTAPADAEAAEPVEEAAVENEDLLGSLEKSLGGEGGEGGDGDEGADAGDEAGDETGGS